MKTLTLILTFLPLIVFSVMARFLPHDYIGFAGLTAAVIAVIAIARSHPIWPPKIINACSLVLFALIAVLGFTLGHHDDRWLANWGGAGLPLIIGLIILVLVPVVPFTGQFARETTPRAYWSSPTFHADADPPAGLGQPEPAAGGAGHYPVVPVSRAADDAYGPGKGPAVAAAHGPDDGRAPGTRPDGPVARPAAPPHPRHGGRQSAVRGRTAARLPNRGCPGGSWSGRDRGQVRARPAWHRPGRGDPRPARTAGPAHP